ncbi:hypothetical protein WR25_12037 [Diploscapter pachys]|uniref:Uncharacterized protein n=1 Tax=Diploscapter pachys TaxID=2018661 RepID=A0A2A2LMU8_9BILA|nr:hypothetical protein WR25_12037 [Diploscapter pachys]
MHCLHRAVPSITSKYGQTGFLKVKDKALALTAESTVGVVGNEFGRFGKFGILPPPPPVEPFAANAEANLLAISELLNAAMKLAGLNGETPRLARA